jgi:hypothetical protein
LKEQSPQFNKLQEDFSITELKMNPFYLVIKIIKILFHLDEVKWAIRMPARYAIRELALNYEEEVQNQTLRYLASTIKYDYLNGSKELNLDLTVKEVEYMFAAN